MNIDDCQEMINAFLGDEEERQLNSDVESHLTDCPDCIQEMATWQNCFDWLKKTFPDQAPPVELWEKIQAGTKTQ